MYHLNPKLHKIKNKKALKKADIWPCDIITTNDKDKWVLTSENVAVKYNGYVGVYSHRALTKAEI